MPFEPADDGYEQRVRASFARQLAMQTLGITIERVAPGEVDLAFTHRPGLVQQHGFLHAGVLATALDSACGYAAYTLMPADAGVLSIEFKVNLLSPANGERFVARGRVVRAGRTISVCTADAFARLAAGDKLIATMTGTMMCLRDQAEITG